MCSAQVGSIDIASHGQATAPPAADGYGITAAPDFSMRRMCRIRHNYHRHPLMQLDALAQLARSLMATKQCRFIVPGSTDASKFDHKSAPPDGRSIEEVFSRLHESGSWVALYNVQTDPVYGQFLRDVLASAARVVQHQEAVYDVRGFIFISAPPSVTPFHIDRENNFWLQLHGRKTLSVWDHRDRDTVAAADVERFISYGSLDNVKLTDGARERANAFDCGAGRRRVLPQHQPAHDPYRHLVGHAR